MLVLGHSNIARRRVIPALRAIGYRQPVSVATSGYSSPVAPSPEYECIEGYEVGLAKAEANTVYISLPNALHFDWALKAVETGRNVIVDKPAFLDREQTETVLEAASKRGVAVAEATVFNFHTQFAQVTAFFADHGPLECVTAHFIIPPLPASNFRCQPALGGGCLLDMGPYAAALIRLFGDANGACVAFGNEARGGDGVDTGFSVLSHHPGTPRIAGQFSFRGEYQNILHLVGRGGSIIMDRPFSAPPDFEPDWQVRRANQGSVETIPADDAFASFFKAFFQAHDAGDADRFAQDMLTDVRIRDQIANTMGKVGEKT